MLGDTLAAADLTNRKTDEANHNAREVQEILVGFRAARRGLMNRVGALPSEAPMPVDRMKRLVSSVTW